MLTNSQPALIEFSKRFELNFELEAVWMALEGKLPRNKRPKIPRHTQAGAGTTNQGLRRVARSTSSKRAQRSPAKSIERFRTSLSSIAPRVHINHLRKASETRPACQFKSVEEHYDLCRIAGQFGRLRDGTRAS